MEMLDSDLQKSLQNKLENNKTRRKPGFGEAVRNQIIASHFFKGSDPLNLNSLCHGDARFRLAEKLTKQAGKQQSPA
jgi:hypothetical protein